MIFWRLNWALAWAYQTWDYDVQNVGGSFSDIAYSSPIVLDLPKITLSVVRVTNCGGGVIWLGGKPPATPTKTWVGNARTTSLSSLAGSIYMYMQPGVPWTNDWCNVYGQTRTRTYCIQWSGCSGHDKHISHTRLLKPYFHVRQSTLRIILMWLKGK